MQSSHTRDALRDLGWGKTKAACYCTLVEYGEMKASEVAAHIDTRQEKVYNPLKRLESEGYVLASEDNPTQYRAQNPRFVISEERREFNEDTDIILADLEEAWARSQEGITTTGDYAWVLSGKNGMRTGVADFITNTDESLAFVDSRFHRTPPYVMDEFDTALEGGVTMTGVANEGDRLSRIESNGAEVRFSNDISSPAFYISDESSLLLNVASERATVVFEDRHFAGIMLREFEAVFSNSEELDQ